MNYVEGITFERQNSLAPGEYENCTFVQCKWPEASLRSFRFVHCTFTECELSNANVKDTIFNEVSFISCKLTGVLFSECNDFLFQITCQRCQMQLCSFYNRKMKGFRFTECDLSEADFGNAQCEKMIFDQCLLKNTIFDNANLEQADLSTSKEISIDPVRTKIKKASFHLSSLPGLLEQYQLRVKIH
ncbi:MAG: pentapeptide repeat-containing protein [Cytophagaceae bacterium]|jgi:uncharacterized protein YjbI with pentapeptide repeats|nr:pentapeptide repeat-containing protein [Cytophagaceae bacterium]